MMIFSSIFCKTFLVLFRSLFPCCISMNCLPSFQEQPQCLQDLLEPSSLTFNTSEFHPGVDTNFNCLLLLETFIIIISLFIKEYRDSGARREETKQKTGALLEEIGALLEEIEELHGKIGKFFQTHILLPGGRLNTSSTGGRHNYMLIGGKNCSRLVSL
ncbi:uncharacterized protein LOC121472083 isoform X8 [Vulpes lagopus]|uniref:uncharacterized protein LOC121472083 isoform X8 n=2 Tax=Vulpes lagopus TaxID=494514 RepID=UPI001BC9BC8A|nr:uncharacterized protein LOC121472083 isoform X8 [Vulpes lagopus]